MDVGSQLLHALVQKQESQEFLRFQLKEDLFYGQEVEVFKFVAGHVDKFHQLPKLETLKEKFSDLPKAPEPPMYYLDQVEHRHVHKQMNRVLMDCNAMMKEQDSWTALNMIEEMLHQLRNRELVKSVHDFTTTGSDLVTDEITRIKLLDDDANVELGWPTFDKMAGGIHGGDIISIIGRPAMGKTWFVLYIAHYLWMLKNRNIMAVSMEMDVLSIAQRLVAISSKVEAKHIRTAYDLSGAEITKMGGAMKKIKAKKNHLWLMDGNMHAQVDQIFTVVRQLKPEVLLIDGAYLLGHPDPRMDKFKRVDTNVELIKKRASEVDIPVVLSYQFNRQAVKKWKGKKDEGGSLEDIAYADAIGQVSSAVLAMHQEDTVETAKQRMIRVLKCRSGQVGKFNVHWDFNQMNFSELLPEKVSEMKFV